MFTAFLINFDVTESLNDGVKKGGLGQNMNYDNNICISDWPILKSCLKTGRNKKIGMKNEFSCA